MAERAAEPGELSLLRGQRARIATRLPRFAALWLFSFGCWSLALWASGRMALAMAIAAPAAHAVLLLLTMAVCRAAPTARRVRPLVFGVCVVLGWSVIGLAAYVGAPGDFLAFLLLTLYLLAAHFLSWGWPVEAALLALTIAPWVAAVPVLPFDVPTVELVTAITVGSIISMAIAEGSARAFALAFHRGEAERNIRQALEGSRNAFRDVAREADAARLQAEHAKVQAEEAARSRDHFLATVSHDIRSPLGVVLTWTRMLRRGLIGVDEVPRVLARIEEAARQQARLVEDLLDQSRMAARKFSIQPEPVDLAALLRERVEAIRQAASVKNLKLDADLERSAIVRGDPARLRQVFDNLLSNAVKFTPEGGRINLRLEQVNGMAHVSVRDTGIGIAPEDLPHVFEQFQQAGPALTRRYGGLGLGLAIARHLVELHGGHIEAESAGEHLGATFRVQLPLAEAAALPSIGDRERTSAEPLPTLDHVRVLVVDDEPSARELLATLLVRCGADVRLAGSVREALESVATSVPDVVVTDIAMPDQDGYTLLRHVRAMEREQGRHIGAVAVTARAAAEDRERALAEGFDVHLTKPIEPAELVEAVSRTSHAAA